VYYRLYGQNTPTPDSSATSFVIQHWWNSNPYRTVVGTGYFYNFSMPAVTVARSSCVQDVALNFNYELGMAMVPNPSYPLHTVRIGADSTYIGTLGTYDWPSEYTLYATTTYSGLLPYVQLAGEGSPSAGVNQVSLYLGFNGLATKIFWTQLLIIRKYCCMCVGGCACCAAGGSG